MTNDRDLVGEIESDVMGRLVSRRAALRQGVSYSARTATALSLGSVPLAIAALSRDVYGQSTPATVQAVINFALMLEIFENEFYKAVLGTSASAAQNAAFAPVRAMVPAAALPALQQIQKHEAAHVGFLQANGAVNTLDLSSGSGAGAAVSFRCAAALSQKEPAGLAQFRYPLSCQRCATA